MKFTIGILVGIIVGALAIIGVLSYMLVSGFFSSNEPANAAVNSPTPKVTSIGPSTTAASITSSSPAKTGTSTPASSTPPATSNPALPVPSASSASGVVFDLLISNYDYSASRPTTGTVYASITNKGSSDAHNTQVKMELYCGDKLVKINYDNLDSQDYYQKKLGTIKAGDTVTDQATINVGLIDGLKIAANGAFIVLTITSDEKNDTLNYEILPLLGE